MTGRSGAVRTALVASLLVGGLAAAVGATAGGSEARLRPAGVPSDLVAPVDDEAGASARVRALQSEIRGLLPLDRRSGGEWGVLVTSLERGDTLFAHNAHRTFAPASNVKLLTAAAALHHLGPEYRFRTFLLATGSTDEGVLEGDLFLYGTGDPSLSDRSGDRAFRRMARRLRERGIRAVEGDVLGDGTYFSGATRPEGWSRRDLNDWFAAPVTGLSYNENVATLRIGPGPAPGTPLRVETIPRDVPIPMEITGRTVAGRPGHPVWAVREEPTEPVEIVGELRTTSTGLWRRLTVNDPALYAAHRLRQVLVEEGIEVRGEARQVESPSASPLSGRSLWVPAMDPKPRPRILAEHASAPLSELLKVVNKRSHNLYAEAILRTLGRVVAGDASFRSGTRVVHRFLVERAGVPPDEVRPFDGSGLSPENRVSPHAFVRLLDHMARSPHWEPFWATLPEAGNYRELSRMYRSPAARNLRAKTGTIERVSALSGVVRAASGERLAFSIVSNDIPSTGAAKRVEDRVSMRLASFWRPSDGFAANASASGRDD